MKRSEMLEKLEVLICNSNYIDVPCSRYLQHKELAEEILSELEKAGMQPPEMSEQVTYEDEVYTVFKYQWEAE